MDWINLASPVIVAAVPIAVAYTKRFVGEQTWLIPLFASGLGVAADAVAAVALNVPVDPQTGAILGLAGVGLREVVNQLGKATKPA